MCGYEERLHPLRTSKSTSPTVVNLLFFNEHYCLIRDFNALMSSQRKHTGAMFWCTRCYTAKYSQLDLDEHMANCDREQRVTMPNKKVLAFQNVKKQVKMPLVVYADF